MKNTFSYIVEFRGGIYCSQVIANSLEDSLIAWVDEIEMRKSKIQYLGAKTIEEITAIINDEEYRPVLLEGLHNIWCMFFSTKKGKFNIHIIQTDVS